MGGTNLSFASAASAASQVGLCARPPKKLAARLPRPCAACSSASWRAGRLPHRQQQRAAPSGPFWAPVAGQVLCRSTCPAPPLPRSERCEAQVCLVGGGSVACPVLLLSQGARTWQRCDSPPTPRLHAALAPLSGRMHLLVRRVPILVRCTAHPAACAASMPWSDAMQPASAQHAVASRQLPRVRCVHACLEAPAGAAHAAALQGGRVVSKRGEAGSAEVPTHEAFDVGARTWAAQPSMLQHRTALAAASLQVWAGRSALLTRCACLAALCEACAAAAAHCRAHHAARASGALRHVSPSLHRAGPATWMHDWQLTWPPAGPPVRPGRPGRRRNERRCGGVRRAAGDLPGAAAVSSPQGRL